ncbi:hypothetical protein [Candidatus Phytoplasma asteris]
MNHIAEINKDTGGI